MAARITPELAAVWAGLSFPLLITAGDNKIQARPNCSENQQRERRNSTPSVISRFGVSGFVDSEADDWWQAATHTQRRKFHSKVTSQHFRPPAGGPSRGTHLDRRRQLSAYENQNKQNKTKRPGPMNVLLELDTRLPIWRCSDFFPQWPHEVLHLKIPQGRKNCNTKIKTFITVDRTHPTWNTVDNKSFYCLFIDF